jgi:hypothetical protein
MADFRLDRIKFRWKSTWTSGSTYTKDDIVLYQGKAFVCLQGHTAAENFYTDKYSEGEQTFAVTVSVDSLNSNPQGHFYIDGEENPTLSLLQGRTYTFNQSDVSNVEFNNEAHPLLISNLLNGELAGASRYDVNIAYFLDSIAVTSDVYIANFLTATTRLVVITIPASAPAQLYYYSPLNVDMGAPMRTAYNSQWELMFDGYAWKNEWTPNTFYSEGNIVKYKGYLYQCVTSHTSVILANVGLPSDIINWKVYATTFNWLNTWTTSTYYDLGDVIRYNGVTYICSVKHTSAATAALGLEDDITSWNIVTRSDNWRYNWTADTRYVLDDIVRYGATQYRCIEGHTSAATEEDGLEANVANWETVSNGIEYKTDWVPGFRYKSNDVVKYGGMLWKALEGHTSSTEQELLRADASSWEIFVPGLEFDSIWAENIEYQVGDIVLHRGYSYTALQNNAASVPSVNGILQDTGDWELLTQGYNHLGEWDIDTAYLTGDVVRNSGYLYIALQDSTGEYPDSNIAIWQVLVTGSQWRAEWEDNIEYFLGDIVTYASTAYICIGRHNSSSSDSRPDLDQFLDEADYWTLLIQGSPNNRLTNQGDIKVYDTEDTKLSIGNFGEALTVSSDILPNWIPSGLISKVYYVSVEGTDTPSSGTTQSSPFRTVKYACDFILDDFENRAPATVFIKTGIYEEILPISVPANVALVGDELRSTVIMPQAGDEGKDMFYVRNGSGIRNMTLQGLFGSLGAANEYLTKRPGGGAFVSLDPGAGVDDVSVQITTKSPYVQNVSTFGTGCTGMHIDGALHNGGNKSIVANDFTQIISDGIGYWAEAGGRSELVSVFTYFCHIGYLAESGGVLRATNGNNSYGEYGSVAEGYSLIEDPITALVNNRSKHAQFIEAFTYGTNEQKILAIAYSNAGRGYTTASATFGGSGFSAVSTFEEFRNAAISQIRVIDPGDSSQAGGLNYQYIVNSAQTGNDGEIYLSQADVGTEQLYVGQRLVIISGLGVGQYGQITGYNADTKLAIISRESDDSLGFDHFQPGWPIEPILDGTTKYAIEPRVVVSEPGFSTQSLSSPSSDTWKYIAHGSNLFITVSAGGFGGSAYVSTSLDGTSWSSASELGSYTISGVVFTGSKWLIAVEAAGATAADIVLQSADGQNWTAVLLPVTADWTGIASDTSGNVTLTSRLGQALYSSDHGDSWSVGTLPTTNQQWRSAVYGNGKFVVTDNAEGAIAYSTNNGSTWTRLTAKLSAYNWTSITYGNGRFVAIAESSLDSTAGFTVSAYSFDGINWYESIIEIGDFTHVTYGAGAFMATGFGNIIAKSADGKVWRTYDEDSTIFTTTDSAMWEQAAYNNGNGSWIVVNSSGVSFNKIITGAKAIIRAKVGSSRITEFAIYDPGSNYATDPIIEVYDNQNTKDTDFVIFVNDGVLAQPEFTNRGQGFVTITATFTGDGFANIYQIKDELVVSNLSRLPGPGDNLNIEGINDEQYSVVGITNVTGTGPYAATLKITPRLDRAESPEHNTPVEIRQQYSQIRLTGHDFLDIGTGGTTSTRYPDLYLEGENPIFPRQPFNETVASNGGRVFYTSTDQDGNFRVGELFAVEQNTGIVTINASQFDLSGLTELSLGGIQIGGSAVVVREFSKDPTLGANSNNIVPTEKAIQTYIASRISGGGSNASTNRLVAGQIDISTTQITTTSALPIQIPVKMNMVDGIDGHYLALQFYSHGGFGGTE